MKTVKKSISVEVSESELELLDNPEIDEWAKATVMEKTEEMKLLERPGLDEEAMLDAKEIRTGEVPREIRNFMDDFFKSRNNEKKN